MLTVINLKILQNICKNSDWNLVFKVYYSKYWLNFHWECFNLYQNKKQHFKAIYCYILLYIAYIYVCVSKHKHTHTHTYIYICWDSLSDRHKDRQTNRWQIYRQTGRKTDRLRADRYTDILTDRLTGQLTCRQIYIF